MKIVLIGFMGSGKSAIAKQVAAELGLRFREMDAEIIARSGCASIAEIFSQQGEEVFRQLETEVARSLAEAVGVVVSTGGGVVGREENIGFLKSAGGKCIFLETPFPEICERLQREGSFKTRPLFRDVEEARELFEAREELYRRYADYVVLNSQREEKEVVREICELCRQ